MESFYEYSFYILTALFLVGCGRFLYKFRTRVKVVEAAEARLLYKELDSTKRKSLQPGSRLKPENWHEKEIDQIVEDKPKHKASDILAKQASRKATQPGVTPYDHEVAAEQARTIQHIFFGSQLTVGDHVVITGLTKSKHRLEITKSNQVFVDSTQVTINPDTVTRVRKELFKLQNPQ